MTNISLYTEGQQSTCISTFALTGTGKMSEFRSFVLKSVRITISPPNKYQNHALNWIMQDLEIACNIAFKMRNGFIHVRICWCQRCINSYGTFPPVLTFPSFSRATLKLATKPRHMTNGFEGFFLQLQARISNQGGKYATSGFGVYDKKCSAVLNQSPIRISSLSRWTNE